jgi:cytochrome c-type biogenesis protein CcmH
MTSFWIAAAVLTALALALVLPALWRAGRTPAHPPGQAPGSNLTLLREQSHQLDAELAAGQLSAEQHQQARAELQRRVLDEESTTGPQAIASLPGRATATMWMLAAFIPAMAFGFYSWVGQPQAVLAASRAEPAAGEVTAAQVETMVMQLAQRLENAPAEQQADPKAWEMLARSYAAVQRFAEADKAYARAITLAPQNAQLLADRADVLAVLQGQNIQGEPLRLVEQALLLDPNNIKALALAGSAAFERGDFPAAVRHWTRARGLVDAGSEFAVSIDTSLAEARAKLALGGSPATAAAGASPAQSNVAAGPASSAQVTGEVSLSPALAARVSPNDTVFIFARAAEGPRMPLAILRHRASELPLRFTLDDSSAMSEGMRLSKFDRVVVGVRISKSGQATPQSGDLTGQAGPVKNVASGLSIQVDSVEP